MSRDRHYDEISYTGPRFKRLSDEERERVGRKVRALRDRTLLRPDLQDVFELCDGVLLALTSGWKDRSRPHVAATIGGPVRALFDKHWVA